MVELTTNECIEIMDKARELGANVINPTWKRAYEELVLAADRIHAMLVRAEVRQKEDEQLSVEGEPSYVEFSHESTDSNEDGE